MKRYSMTVDISTGKHVEIDIGPDGTGVDVSELGRTPSYVDHYKVVGIYSSSDIFECVKDQNRDDYIVIYVDPLSLKESSYKLSDSVKIQELANNGVYPSRIISTDGMTIYDLVYMND